MRTRELIGLVCAVGILATACTGQAAVPPASTPAPTSSAVASTSSSASSVTPTPPSTLSDQTSGPVSSTPSPSKSSSAKPSTSGSRTTSAAPSASSTEIPANLTPKQRSGAKAALATYREYMKLIDAAGAHPGNDWSKEVAKVATGQVASELLATFKGTAENGQRWVGRTVAYPKVTKVTAAGGEVTITACVDARGGDLLDKNGKSILVPDAKGAYRVHPETVVVTMFGNRYLIIKTSADRNSRCTPA